VTFNENVQLDTSQVSGGGGGGRGGGFPGGMQVGGGIGGLILLVLTFVFGGNVLGSSQTSDPGVQQPGQSSPLNPAQVGAGGSQSSASFAQCRTGADANKNDECLVIATVNSVQAYWAQTLPQYGKRYPIANTVLYSGQTQSRCGTASNQVGPFYCPLDKLVYIDASFFQELATRFGAGSGQLAKEYVIAHEYGHHVQDVLGLLGQAQRDPQGPESGSVAPRADGRLPRGHLGQARHGDQGRQRHSLPQADHQGGHQLGPLCRIGGGGRPDPEGDPGAGHAGDLDPRLQRSATEVVHGRATPAATSTSATPSGSPTPSDLAGHRPASSGAGDLEVGAFTGAVEPGARHHRCCGDTAMRAV